MSSSVVQIAPYDRSDPKSGDPLVVPFHLPRDWTEHSDWFGTMSTTLAGAGMVMKNPLCAWVAMNAAVLALFNQRPLRQKKDNGSGPWTAIAMSLAALLATYLPRIIVPANQLAQKLAEAAGGASSTPAA